MVVASHRGQSPDDNAASPILRQKRLQLQLPPARLLPRTILVPQNGDVLQQPNAMRTEDTSGKLERLHHRSPARLHPRT
jgi:hypothetical protein